MPIEFKNIEEVNIDNIVREVEEDRKRVRDILEGKISEKLKDIVKNILVIVESPNKARTIANFFGKPAVRHIGPLTVYEVTLGNKFLTIVATKGHIFDITTEDIENAYYGVLREGESFIPFYTPIKRCKKCGYQWTSEDVERCPRCDAPKEYIEDSRDRVEVLKKLAKEADLVLIGTDPDSVSKDSVVKVKINEKVIEKTVEELFNEFKNSEDFEYFERDDHEFLKPKKVIYVRGVDEKLRIVWTKVNYIIRHRVSKTIYKIRTKSGKEIKVTGDHSLFTLRQIYEPLDLEFPTISLVLSEDEFKDILENQVFVSKLLTRSEFTREELGNLLEKVSGFYRKVFVTQLRRTIPLYYIGVDSTTRKRMFSIILTRKLKLKEVKASQLKEGDKIVVVNGNRVMLDEIEKIEKEKLNNEYVYDFDTETDNFIANDVLCHNTEGEFIAWSTYLAIKPFSKEIKRMEFHEVTRNAILKALEDFKEINLNRVKAQIVRRVEDRWIGFALSKKVQELFNRKTLSAGRVQTPVLGWIIQRLIEHKKSIQFFITIETDYFNLTLDDLEIKDAYHAREIANKIKQDKLKILSKEFFKDEIKPLPPYITNTMLNDAIRYMKLGANQIMQLAQELFELGLITYHRTDSTRVSSVGIGIAKEYISEKWGEEYFYPRSWGEGGAHECIRPTRPWDPDTLQRMISEGELELVRPLTRQHLTLYSLIFYRFMASQMRPTIVKKVRYTIHIPSIDYKKEREGIVEIVQNGWNLALGYSFDYQMIPDVSELQIKNVYYWKGAKVRLFTQADVISLMKERGIGRPSTYAQIMQKLLDRKYVVESKGKRLIPTPLGIMVYEYLNTKYSNLVSESRTRELEQKMDMVEEGKVDYKEVLKETYEEMIRVENQKDDYREIRKIILQKVKEIKGLRGRYLRRYPKKGRRKNERALQ